MVETVFSMSFYEYAKILLVALLLYAIIFAMLKKIAFFDDQKVNALVSILSVLLVSFSGIVTYIVTYAINWFAIIFFIAFVVILLLLFLGMSYDDITSMINPKIVGGIIGVLFLIIIFKGFFGVNNTFDISDPQENPYEVNTSFNTGTNDVTKVDVDSTTNFLDSLDSELVSVVFFLLIIGIFVILIGK